MINQILSILKISALALVLSIGLSYAFAAWAPPTQLPPDGNAPTPINVATSTQTKIGGDICTTVSGTTKCLQTVGGSASLPSGVAGQTLRNIGGTNWATSSLIFNDGTNVGIGTTTPGAKFHVSAGNSSMALFGPNASWGGKLIVGATTNTNTALTAQVISTDGNLHLDPAPGNNMYLGYYQPRDMYLNANGGNVGIGTAVPTARLDVNGNIRQTVTHGNNMGLVMPAANNGGGTGQVGLYSWISEPSATWTGGGIARNMINSSASFPRINTGLSGQMMHFTEAGNIEFTTETGAGVRINPLILSSAGTATIYRDASINGVTVGKGAGNVASNTAVGGISPVNGQFGALGSNSTGRYNAAIGGSTLQRNTIGNNNTAIGSESLLNNINGNSNVAIGSQALISNSTGGWNIAVGTPTMWNNSSGSRNVAVGYMSLYSNSTGSFNTAIGDTTLRFNEAGSYNTALGNGAGPSTWGAFTNTTALGNGAVPAASNRVRIGDTAVTQIGGQVGWSALSDARQKENVADYAHGLDFITKLRPVTFTMKDDTTKVPHSGFIAQEVESTGIPFYGLNKPANEKDFYSLSYAEFVVPLVNSVKELKAENDSLSEKVNKLQAENDALLSRIEKIEEKLK